MAARLSPGPYTLLDPNKALRGDERSFRPAWVLDVEGKELFCVSMRGDPAMGRFVVDAMNAEFNRRTDSGTFYTS